MTDSSEPLKGHAGGARFSLRALLLSVAVVCVVTAGIVWLNRWIHDFNEALMLGAPGPIETSNDLPDALRPLIESETGLRLDGKTLLVHCLQSGWDAEYVCKIEANARLRDHIVERFGMSPEAIPQWSIFLADRTFTRSQTPLWKIPKVAERDAYFASSGFMNRQPNDRYEMLYNADRGELYLHHYYDC